MPRPVTLIFVHGWSVIKKDTYGGLPEALNSKALSAGLEIDMQHIYLGRYVSFHDEITLDDIAHAFDYALRTDLPNNDGGKREFSCITHSTGGPLIRRWVDIYYGAEKLSQCPLRHLVMLAPANHGSALAALGKSRVGRIKSWFQGVEPGQGVLDWLSLGSMESWSLQDKFTNYSIKDNHFFPFVLSGESIDEKFYDFVNGYLVEKGTDGVVRLAAANLNYSFFRLEQTEERLDEGEGAYKLRLLPRTKQRPDETAFCVIPDASHSGKKLGIMGSVTVKKADKKPVVDGIITCLSVSSRDDYGQVIRKFSEVSTEVQKSNAAIIYNGHLRRFVMFVFRVRDDEGRLISDYDLMLLGNEFRADRLPKGFFIDKQKNPKSQALIYYLDYEALSEAKELGIRVHARPSFGELSKEPSAFAGYLPAEFRFSGRQFSRAVRPNETVYIDICLTRNVATETMRLDPSSSGRGSFKRVKPGSRIPR